MIIIPARIASTRFPKKILYPIDGIPMVIRTAMQVKDLDEVVIATDSQEVVKRAKEFHFEAILTNPNHKSGTDRINEAATILGVDEEEFIINVQADEPFIEQKVVKSVMELTKKHHYDKEVMMNSAYKKAPLQSNDPNSVKVVVDSANFALYFSRSTIPYPREKYNWINIHLGIYGYTKKMLSRFCALKSAPLEEIEKLEQLRALYHGYKIALVEVESQSIGIDTIKDLEKLQR